MVEEGRLSVWGREWEFMREISVINERVSGENGLYGPEYARGPSTGRPKGIGRSTDLFNRIEKTHWRSNGRLL